MLELRPSCEHCNKALPPASLEARICSFECTFCARCVDEVLGGVCPNCGGGFVPRPVRPTALWKGNHPLGKHPASTQVKHRPVDVAAHAALSAALKNLPAASVESAVPAGPTATLHIALESPDQPDVIALIAELDAYQDLLYPPESRHLLDLASLKQPHVLFAVARDAAALAIGCGAVVLGPDCGELKRMYVHPRGRGRGAAKALLALLEAQARQSGCSLLKLESGPYQPEALGLYARCGYERCGPFGKYTNDPLSVFMQKRIAG